MILPALCCLVFFAAGSDVVFAGRFDPQAEFKEAYRGTFEVDLDAAQVTGRLIRTVLTYVGVLILLVIIYAGFLWVMARGNEQEVDKAKKILTGAVIGLIIIFASSALVSFVLTRLQSGLGSPGQ